MLGSRRLYRAIRIVLGILTILSMLGISLNIFAENENYLSLFNSKLNDDIYNNLDEKVKNNISSHNGEFNCVMVVLNNQNVMYFNIVSIGAKQDNFLNVKINKLGNYNFNNDYYFDMNDNMDIGIDLNNCLVKFNFNNEYYNYFDLPNTFNVNINIIGNGDVIGGGIYNEGENVNLIATPHENNAFVGFFSDPELLDLVSSDSEYTINNIESDITLYAQFIELGNNPDPDNPIFYNSDDYKYLSSICIVVCMIFWNNVLKEYL